MRGVDAAYHYAGMIGIRPERLTLSQLWRMSNGRAKQSRVEIIELASMVWGLDSVDRMEYLLYGNLVSTGKGKPVQLEPELQAKVDAEVERIRRENPGLPKAKGVK